MAHEYAARVCLDGRVQTVKEHICGVRDKALKDAGLLGCTSIVSLVCLLHDMGKNTAYSDRYQHTVGLGGEWHQEKPIHSHAGARLIFEEFYPKNKTGSPYAQVLSELLETVIMSHHGLFDCLRAYGSGSGYNGLKQKLDNLDYDYEEAKDLTLSDIVSKEELDTLFTDSERELEAVWSAIKRISDSRSEVCYYLSMFERMILSVLVNADHTDAAEFSSQENIPSSYGNTDHWQKCCKHLERELEVFEHTTEIQFIRNEISQRALAAAEQKDTIIRMSVPTGGGKTLSSLRYALNHARLHHKSRIIYAAPFNSILEQNAGQFRKVLPEDAALLEHFGDMIDFDEKISPQYRYFSENWGSPIIATSMVQLLNTLFSGKMTSVRRMRGLINSVIILDEIQSVPIECISMLNLAVNFLSEVCGCTIVLCSATQPSLDRVKHRIRLSERFEMIENYQEYAKRLKRTQVVDSTKKEGYTYQEAADFVLDVMNDTKSVLLIVNTKAAARAVYSIIKDRTASLSSRDDCYVVHLSTNMCPVHRKKALAELREKLGSSKKVICISTQLIEAGVDISFATVIRSLAGLDSIIQSAGRCNRNMETDIGNVHIVNLSEENISRLKTIRIGSAITRQLLETMRKNQKLFDGDLIGEEAVGMYYDKYFGEFVEELDYPLKSPDTTLYQLLSSNSKVINAAKAHGFNDFNSCFNQSFKTAGEEFKAIDDYSHSVVVPYGRGKELIARLCSDTHAYFTTEFFRELQKYSIGLSDKMLEGRVIRDSETGILMLKEGFYHDEYGFDENGEAELLLI